MNSNQSTRTNDETDALYRTSPAAMAERFGAYVRERLRQGKDVTVAAQIAFRYAFIADPSLRVDPDTRLSDAVFAIGVSAARAQLADLTCTECGRVHGNPVAAGACCTFQGMPNENEAIH